MRCRLALGCPPGEMEFSQYKDQGLEGLDAHCVLPLDRRGLQFTGQLELKPIRDFLKGAGVDELEVNVWVPSYGAVHCDPPADEKDNFGNEKDCRYRLPSAAGERDVVLFSFGYDAAGVGRIVGILGLLLLSPLAMVFWFRRRARGVSEESKPAIVFAYGRFLRWTAMGGALVWWSAIDLLHADRLAGLLLPANFSSDSAIVSIAPWLLLWLPPATIYFLCLVLSTPIQLLRGATRTWRQAVRRSFWTVARFVIPVSFVALGFAELPSGSGITVLLFVGAFFSLRICLAESCESLRNRIARDLLRASCATGLSTSLGRRAPS